jgi:hypothetical protein
MFHLPVAPTSKRQLSEPRATISAAVRLVYECSVFHAQAADARRATEDERGWWAVQEQSVFFAKRTDAAIETTVGGGG